MNYRKLRAGEVAGTYLVTSPVTEHDILDMAKSFARRRFILDRDWVQRPFFTKYDEEATSLNPLELALGESEFFFEREFVAMRGEEKYWS